jgi:hypothetical protein
MCAFGTLTGENAHLYRAEYFLSDLTSVQNNATESPIDLRVCFARVASEAESRNLDKVKKTPPMQMPSQRVCLDLLSKSTESF